MAFMMPVMKKEFDIYKPNRSRRTSECSNGSACRSRKISECRSECPSLSTSPGNEYTGSGPGGVSPMHHHHHRSADRSQSMQMSRNTSRPTFSRTSSRTSQQSLITSPTKTAGGGGCSPPKASGSESSINKFHLRLVDKLRKSLRKGRSEERS